LHESLKLKNPIGIAEARRHVAVLAFGVERDGRALNGLAVECDQTLCFNRLPGPTTARAGDQHGCKPCSRKQDIRPSHDHPLTAISPTASLTWTAGSGSRQAGRLSIIAAAERLVGVVVDVLVDEVYRAIGKNEVGTAGMIRFITPRNIPIPFAMLHIGVA